MWSECHFSTKWSRFSFYDVMHVGKMDDEMLILRKQNDPCDSDQVFIFDQTYNCNAESFRDISGPLQNYEPTELQDAVCVRDKVVALIKITRDDSKPQNEKEQVTLRMPREGPKKREELGMNE